MIIIETKPSLNKTFISELNKNLFQNDHEPSTSVTPNTINAVQTLSQIIKNAFENVVWKKVAILSQPQCVESEHIQL